MRKGDFTVIVARYAETPARKFTFSPKLVLSISLALLALFSSFVLSTLHYYHMWQTTGEYARLKTEVDLLRKENETFRLAANQLNEKVSGLEVTSKKLKIVSGLDKEGLGGAGGPAGNIPRLSLNSRDLVKYFKSLDRKTVSLEMELRRLQEYYTTESILRAATPSLMPVRGYPSDSFGYRVDPFTGKRDFHPGVDISAPWGNKVVAPADGLVVFAGRWAGYGKLVRIDHRFGVSTWYGHLASYSVSAGQRVKRGDIVGYVGSTGRATGPHLHYEVRLNAQPLNPLRFFRELD